MKVIVGMSGGVDSSMAAYLLKEAGHEVEGLSFILYEARTRTDPTACCSIGAMEDAAKTARHIGIPHGLLDVRAEFVESVIGPFIDAYSNGFTPNPCILCNRHIKFPFLLKEAVRRGADCIATGHYAVVERGPHGSTLKKGVDPKKDQSYVLYVLRREELERLVLPLGGFTKKEIRAKAKELGLPAAERPESQEICFISEGSYSNFIGSYSPDRPGPILGEDGKTVGVHRGIHHYTIGQRKGLGIPSPHPFYVTGINASDNSIRIGRTAESSEFSVKNINWLSPKPGDFRADVKVRSAMEAKPASISFEAGGKLKVVFDSPQWAPAPGQSAVFYDGDAVIGGGTICV